VSGYEVVRGEFGERLVVEHELVGPPHAVAVGLVAGGEALFEAGGPIRPWFLCGAPGAAGDLS
jgi:hypothetical protein